MPDMLVVFELLFAIILSVVCVEILHGTSAYLLGDKTGMITGRLMGNPLHHIDLFGTVLFPLLCILSQSQILLAWALPIPIDYNQIRYGRLGQILVILSRIFAHILLAFIAAVLIHICKKGSLNQEILFNVFHFNIIISAFLCLPVLPLPGGEFISLVLPAKFRLIYEQHRPYGAIILLILILVPSLLNLDIISHFILQVAVVIQRIVLLLSGHG